MVCSTTLQNGGEDGSGRIDAGRGRPGSGLLGTTARRMANTSENATGQCSVVSLSCDTYVYRAVTHVKSHTNLRFTLARIPSS